MHKYEINDEVWTAYYGYTQIQKQCPVCFGKCKVTLILGNDEHVILPCTYCNHGFGDPTGEIAEYEYISSTKLICIDRVSIEQTPDGEERRYYSNNYVYDQDNVFDTQAQALAKCDQIKAQLETEQATRAEYLKHDKKKSFAWNAGYHLREAKNLKTQIKYHEKQAILCKAHAKED